VLRRNSEASLRVTVSRNDATLTLRRHADAQPPPSGSIARLASVSLRPGRQVVQHPAAVPSRDLQFVALEESTWSEDDLRVMAKHGYEGAASTDQDQQAQAVSLFITDMLAASIG
jgi:hypothetical protein